MQNISEAPLLVRKRDFVKPKADFINAIARLH